MSGDSEQDQPENQSLIEFPCDFPIKIMGLNTPKVRAAIMQAIDAHVYRNLDDDQQPQKEIREQTSRTGKYVSLTVTMYYQSQLELDNVYRRLTGVDGVRMVL